MHAKIYIYMHTPKITCKLPQMTMLNCNLVLPLFFLLLLPLCLGDANGGNPIAITYHGGGLLTGNLNLVFIWYGQFGRVQKNLLRSFVTSLNYNAAANLQPQVSQWWNVVENFQNIAGKGDAPTKVKVIKQVVETNYTLGKEVTYDSFKSLIEKEIPDDRSFPVVFTANDVKVQGLCTGKCSQHGLINNKPYLLVGNPETQCPAACAWPFHKADDGLVGVTMNPPNGNLAADAMVVNFAKGLVNYVTNPWYTGFFQENNTDPIEAGSACEGIFGSGALLGYAGKVRIDPATGGAFNVHGSRGRKFLLPSIWDPAAKNCWTLM